jgi:hypothetical protein
MSFWAAGLPSSAGHHSPADPVPATNKLTPAVALALRLKEPGFGLGRRLAQQ